MTDNGVGLATPRRQHIVGLLVLLGWQSQHILRAAWPILIAAYLQQENDAKYFLWALSLGGLATLLGAVLHFWRFTFSVSQGKFHVHKGIFVREKINIPLERVQAVHIEQNLVQRLFGVSGVRVDTAGSSGSELRIHALKWDEAQSLRSLLTADLSERADLPKDQRHGAKTDVIAEAETKNSPQRRAITDLDFRTLLCVGLSQNHLSKVAFAVGGLVTFQGFAWEILTELWTRVPGIWRSILLFLSPLILIVSPVIIAMTSVMISLISSILRHWKLQLWVEGSKAKRTSAVHLTQGMLNRQSMQIPIHKVQYVTWESTWIRRLFSMDTVHIRQAAAGGAVQGNGGGTVEGGSVMRMGIPAMNSKRTRQLEALLFPSWPQRSLITIRPEKYSFWVRWFRRSLALLPVAVGFGWWLGVIWGLVLGAFLWTWSGWLSLKIYRGQWATTDGRHLSTHQGWWFRKRIMIDWHKLQAVEMTQNRIQAHRDVAHLTFHTSSGVAHLRFLSTDLAKDLRDLAMAQVHANRGPWM